MAMPNRHSTSRLRAGVIVFEAIDRSLPLWQALGQSESSRSHYAWTWLQELSLGKPLERRLEYAGVRTVGRLLGCSLDDLGLLPRIGEDRLRQVCLRLGEFLDVPIELPAEVAVACEAAGWALTEEIVRGASGKYLQQIPQSASVAALCGIGDPNSLSAECLSTPIADIRPQMGTRACCGLEALKVDTVSELLKPDVSIERLMQTPRLGLGSVWDIVTCLYRFCHSPLATKAAPVQASSTHFQTRLDFHSEWDTEQQPELPLTTSDSLHIIASGVEEACEAAQVLGRLDERTPLRQMLGLVDAPPLKEPVISARLGICNRGVNGLQRAGWHTVDDVLDVCLRDLLNVRALGIGSVWQIVASLYRFTRDLQAATTIPGAAAPEPQQDAGKYFHGLMASSPQREWTASALAEQFARDARAKPRAAAAAVSSLPLLAIGPRVRWLEGDDPRALIESGQAESLAALLDEALSSIASERNIGVFKRRFGLSVESGGEKETLQELADSSRSWNGGLVTRERVRQIVSQTQRQLLRNEQLWPLLSWPLRSVMRQAGGFARMEAALEALEEHADVLGPIPLAGYVRFMMDTDDRSYQTVRAAKQNRATRRFVRAKGTHLDALQVLVAQVKSRLEEEDEPLDEREVEAMLRQSWPSRQAPLPESPKYLCECLWLDLDLELNDGQWMLHGDNPQRWGVVQHMVAIMREAGQPMHFTQLAAAFREQVREVSDKNIHARLGGSPEVFALVGPGTFGLVEAGHKRGVPAREPPASWADRSGAAGAAGGRPSGSAPGAGDADAAAGDPPDRTC